LNNLDGDKKRKRSDKQTGFVSDKKFGACTMQDFMEDVQTPAKDSSIKDLIQVPLYLEAEHLTYLKPVALVGVIEKVSGWGFSTHKRLLKLDTRALSYYSTVPEKFESMKSVGTTLVDMKGNKHKPKMSVPLEAIMKVAKVDDEDRRKEKQIR
jgi:hypothetical protein